MKTHRSNPNALSDERFEVGSLELLVVGNSCRLLDQRRTPGVIISIDIGAGFFRWQISDFEDRDKFWDVRFEQVAEYQFPMNAQRLSPENTERLKDRVNVLHKPLVIEACAKALADTEEQLGRLHNSVSNWLLTESTFVRQKESIDFASVKGPASLARDFQAYMRSVGMDVLEEKTADIQVLNPASGEWMRGHHIVMAEMGLKSYRGLAPRSKTLFEGIGNKGKRREHILQRLAFLRAMFATLGLKEVTLYRGMATHKEWRSDDEEESTFCSSWTFSHKVAQDFADFELEQNRNAYLLKRVFSVNKLFMTYLESAAMNRQYLEAEALVLHSSADRVLW